jgi:hypothetical protein
MQCRRLTLFDALVLVAALAVGLAASCSYLRFLPGFSQVLTGFSQVSSRIRDRIVAAVPCLAALSLAVIALSLRQPRQRFRRVARRPGVAACWAASLGFLFHLLADGRPVVKHFNFFFWPEMALAFSGVDIMWLSAGCVAASWLTLALAGLWRAERDWVGWLGRAVGVAWIALFIILVISGW